MDFDTLQFVVKDDLVFEQYFKTTPLGLEAVAPDVPLDAFELAGLTLRVKLDTLQWQFGDWAVLLSEQHGVTAYEKVAAVVLSERQTRTVEDWAYVCRGVPDVCRRNDLSFNHHRKVAPLEHLGDQTYWLQKAVDNGWGVRQLGEEIANARNLCPPPRREDTLFELEQENAGLHRKVDNLIRERDTAVVRSERSENKLESIRGIVGRLIGLGPEGLVRDPSGVFGMLKEVWTLLGN